MNWLTHAKNAVHADARVALEGTAHTLTTFGTILLRHEYGAPEVEVRAVRRDAEAVNEEDEAGDVVAGEDDAE